ncbi:MAG: oligopeptide transporter, OPT family [Bacteroidota bacterium]
MAETKHVPFVPADSDMKEFTLRALLIGLVLAVVLGAANAYLGLKAGMTIAATYPAAVIGMALLKALKGTILEENMARTVGSIGESVAAGAIFTLPAFFVAGIWPEFFTTSNYITSTLILISGGVLGIMFVALLRRVMVEDPELPYPESVAAAEIHKAGRGGGGGSKYLFGAMLGGALVKALGEFNVFLPLWERFITFSKTTITGLEKIPLASGGEGVAGTGGMVLTSFKISPAYVGVGYIIGPKLASLNFSGGIIAWGLLTPIILYFIAPYLNIDGMVAAIMAADPGTTLTGATEKAWIDSAYAVWKFIVRPIAIGGMLVGASFTLFRMRNSLTAGIARSISDVKKAASGNAADIDRTEKDIPFTWTLTGIFGVAVATFLITFYLFNTTFLVAFVASTVMIILAFFFAAVSGYLVGIMGSSNNPISGLTLTALVVTALIMVVLGVEETQGVAAVLGVAAIVCVAAAVAGEMLQDLKAGHILGGTPWKMEIGDIIGVVLAGIVMFMVLVFLNDGDIAAGKVAGYVGGFGSRELPAPQASLMAILSRGIVEQQMAWPLIIVGMLMGASFIFMQVKSPMLVSVGMYLPLETTFAIFIGGLMKGAVDMYKAKRKVNAAQDARIENTGVLLASGLIAGEALVGLVFAGFAAFEMFPGKVFENPSFIVSLAVMAVIGWVLIRLPMNNAGSPDEPAPPTAAH